MSELSALLRRLEPALGPRVGEAIPLCGGITNRNYRVQFGVRQCVVRLPGQDTELLGIDRGSERLAAMRAASLGIGPELLYADDECAVTAFVAGTEVDPDRLRADPGAVARSLRAFHDSGLALPGRFWIPDLLRAYAGIVAERGQRLPQAFVRAQKLVDRIAAVLPLTEPVPCHDDLLPGNLIQSGDAILLVDWEYAGAGHRYFDLGNLAVNNGFDERAERLLLKGYFFEQAGADTPGRLAALRLFRLASDAREAAWGVVQGIVSGLDFNFAAYADEHFERLDRAAADPRLEEYLHAATP